MFKSREPALKIRHFQNSLTWLCTQLISFLCFLCTNSLEFLELQGCASSTVIHLLGG